MFKQVTALLLVVLVALSLTSCVPGAAGLKSYVDSIDGYEFLYPNGWLPVQVANGPDVVLHDIIETTENLSVVISPVAKGKTLSELGTPGEVGYRLAQKALAPSDSGRKAELVNAESRESGGKIYYVLEYAVKSNKQERHDLATVAISRDKLFTFNVSTLERRWPKVQKLFETVAKSFAVY